MDYVADEFKKSDGIDLRGDRQALQRLREAAEKAKIELCSVVQTSISLPFVTATQEGPKHLDVTLTQREFEELTHDLAGRTVNSFKRAISDAGIHERILMKSSWSVDLPECHISRTRERLGGGKEPHKGVNPDEVVAVGAAIQAGVLSGQSRTSCYWTLPRFPRHRDPGWRITKLIERNTTIPTRKSEVFTTAVDGQTDVEVHVLQGEREMSQDNKTLGKFHLVGIPPAPRGIPQVEVTFDIDANGIVNVSAKDRATGKEQSITDQRLDQAEKKDIDQMVADAQRNAEEDHKTKEVAEVCNKADSLIYQTEKLITDLGDKVPADPKIDDPIKDSGRPHGAHRERRGKDKHASEELQQASYKLSEILYQSQAAGAEAQPARKAPAPPPKRKPPPKKA